MVNFKNSIQQQVMKFSAAKFSFSSLFFSYTYHLGPANYFLVTRIIFDQQIIFQLHVSPLTNKLCLVRLPVTYQTNGYTYESFITFSRFSASIQDFLRDCLFREVLLDLLFGKRTQYSQEVGFFPSSVNQISRFIS